MSGFAPCKRPMGFLRMLARPLEEAAAMTLDEAADIAFVRPIMDHYEVVVAAVGVPEQALQHIAFAVETDN